MVLVDQSGGFSTLPIWAVRSIARYRRNSIISNCANKELGHHGRSSQEAISRLQLVCVCVCVCVCEYERVCVHTNVSDSVSMCVLSVLLDSCPFPPLSLTLLKWEFGLH